MCSCQHREAVECYALAHNTSFEKALGFGHRCTCSCHKTNNDEQEVANFTRFLMRMGELGIRPTNTKTVEKDS
jgi:hypothetical protein